ncbi:hypothetical protein SAMN05216548_11498 [Faunimonas pinastri]|uniref:Uncharacterized protein n=1 Tax=Faunimonas pinastri TaxID=1855383 RepID=A0A1H9MXK8_9HYPH|nr:hypothetical protein [Faunimonas pinastri]SER28450.1 hypothetical protein SAMN05216548_11498 [Faunimonas pinastri]
MSDLYTVTLSRKKIITSCQGKTKTTREELIEEKYTGLPLLTAQRYRELFPDANVQIVREYAEDSRRSSVRLASEKTERRRTEYPGNARKPASQHAAASKPSTTIRHGDYAELVNTMTREAS